MKELIAFIVFSSVSCLVAAVSAIWAHVRMFVHDIFFEEQPINKRYDDI